MSQLSPAMAQWVRNAETAWNTRDCDALVLSNTIDCHWRNRVYFLWGREQIRTYVARQLRREIDHRVIFEPWAEGDRRLSYRFAAEFRNDSGSWFRAYGSEELAFDEAGLVKRRFTAANEHPIQEHERVLRWAAGPRPGDHPPLSELGF
jgi:nuclear transport factor 2 (NTF2) superfamily protein